MFLFIYISLLAQNITYTKIVPDGPHTEQIVLFVCVHCLSFQAKEKVKGDSGVALACLKWSDMIAYCISWVNNTLPSGAWDAYSILMNEYSIIV